MMNSKISIIVPVYNVEKYLKRCVDSILCQTYKDIEVVLVDDGSPDDCGAICDDYAKLDKRVKVIHKKNGGLSSARNAGLDIASGDYVGFVDSDDWIHPQMYEIAYAAMVSSDADISCFNFLIKANFSGGTEEYKDKEKIINATEVYSKEEVLNSFFNKYYDKLWMTVCTKLYKKHIFDDLRFKEGIIHEDELIMLPTINKASKIAYSDISLYYYFSSENSITRSKYGIKNFDKLYVFRENYKFFEKGTEQYKLGQLRYYIYYLGVLLFTKKHFKIGKEVFSQYKKLYIKDFVEILQNEKICNVFKVTLFASLFLYTLPMKVCERYFEEVYFWVEGKIKASN